MELRLFVLTVIVLLSFSDYGFSEESVRHDEHVGLVAGDQKETTVVSTAVEIGNRICPVSGNKVDDGKMGEAVKYEYNGKIYNLCCKMCIKDFQRDPQRYSKSRRMKSRKKRGRHKNVKEIPPAVETDIHHH